MKFKLELSSVKLGIELLKQGGRLLRETSAVNGFEMLFDIDGEESIAEDGLHDLLNANEVEFLEHL